jgi:hypothetical protein
MRHAPPGKTFPGRGSSISSLRRRRGTTRPGGTLPRPHGQAPMECSIHKTTICGDGTRLPWATWTASDLRVADSFPTVRLFLGCHGGRGEALRERSK